jgi:hypothetical protein
MGFQASPLYVKDNLKCSGHVTRMKQVNASKILVRKPEGKKPVTRHSRG